MIRLTGRERDCKKLFENVRAIPVVGIGVTAFNRIFPGFVYPDYSVVCYKDSDDVEEMGRVARILSIQKDFLDEGDINKLNSLAVLEHKGVEKFMGTKGEGVGIFLYRTTERIDKLCEEKGWRVLANSSQVRDKYEDKKEFFKMGREIGLPMIKGQQFEIEELSGDFYGRIEKKLGRRLVFQLTDFSRGGGKGTFFVNSKDDYGKFLVELEKLNKEYKGRFVHVNVTRFVEGVSASITGCVTRHGVLSGVVQTQVVDVPELIGESNNRGVFKGHDWSMMQYSDTVQKKADKMVKLLGDHMHKIGYKGIFGIDMIVDIQREEVYPVECNPRYTGAFPVYSMLQMNAGEVPLDVFQFLELLEIEYDMDFDAVNQSWKQPKQGAHLVLNNLEKGNWLRLDRGLEAGVYRFDGKDINKVGEGVFYSDLTNEDEFVLTDGVPKQGQLVKPGLRFGKLIFKRGVVSGNSELNEFGRGVVGKIYELFKFRKEER